MNHIFLNINNNKYIYIQEIGHPCIIAASVSDQAQLDIRTEPITPVKLVELLLR